MLSELTKKARAGDDAAAKQLIAEMARGTEDDRGSFNRLWETDEAEARSVSNQIADFLASTPT